MSEAGGDSLSKIVADLLDTAVPALERMVFVLEATAKAKQEVNEDTLRRLQAAEDKFEPLFGEILKQFDEVANIDNNKVHDRSPAVVRRGKAKTGRPPSRETPASNRGVRSLDRGPKTKTNTSS